MMCVENLVGKKVKRIFMNEDYLKFETDQGNVVFEVEGDCCSQSVFYDFYGVKKLLNNGKIISAKEIELVSSDIKTVNAEEQDKKSYQESISVYGYELVTLDEKLGLEVTSVFSFRNYSNGCYGGTMSIADDGEVMPEIFDDVIETEPNKSKKWINKPCPIPTLPPLKFAGGGMEEKTEDIVLNLPELDKNDFETYVGGGKHIMQSGIDKINKVIQVVKNHK